MKQFEYRIESQVINEYLLNELGQEGWQLFVGHNGKWVFKREMDMSLDDESVKR